MLSEEKIVILPVKKTAKQTYKIEFAPLVWNKVMVLLAKGAEQEGMVIDIRVEDEVET